MYSTATGSILLAVYAYGIIRLREAFLVSSFGLLAVLVDRLLVLVVPATGQVTGPPREFVLQTAVVAVLLVLLHGYLFLRLRRTRGAPYVAAVFVWSFSVLFAVSLWGDGTMVAALAVYVIFVGFLVAPVPVAVVAAILWIVATALLSSHPAAWGAVGATIPAAPPFLGATTRGAVYLITMIGYLQYRFLTVVRREARQRRTIDSLTAAVDELSAANMSYNTFVQMAESQAARHERSRITREIHDGVGYALTNLIMLAESTQDIVHHDPASVASRLATIRNQAKLALSDTRRALRELRQAEQGLVYGRPALVHMMEVFEQATAVRTVREFLIPSGTLADERIFPVVYRFVQEALTNSFRHGHATVVELRVWLVESNLVVSVSDDGQSPETIKEGIGLQGMRERLGEIGGELSYYASQGFTVSARIPIPQSEG